MTAEALRRRFAAVCQSALPLPGGGHTDQRHLQLFEVAYENLSLAKLAEAHWDAHAILAEAGRVPKPGMLYGVWASEIAGKPLQFDGERISGGKGFCTGFGLIDRALVTIGEEDGRLLDLDVRPGVAVSAPPSEWQTNAFRLTNTGAVTFNESAVDRDAMIGEPGFYLRRPGFWHGAIGPAACWAGGVAGLLEFADKSSRNDAHTLAHLAAIHANVWAMRSVLQTAGREIDADPVHGLTAQERALKVRHVIEQLATDTLRRFARAYGPFPLAMHAETAQRYLEADLFLRQSHAERDLEALAGVIKLMG